MSVTVPNIDFEGVDRIIDRAGGNPEALIGILQDIQKELRYLPIPALKRVTERLNIEFNRVWAVATFYEAFAHQKQGEVHFLVCEGTACHVNESRDVIRAFEDELCIEAGETTSDGKFSFERAHCLGACAVGPTVAVGETFHGHMTREKVNVLINSYLVKKGDAE